jgi:single-stranded-DNA-specific exonuclease
MPTVPERQRLLFETLYAQWGLSEETHTAFFRPSYEEHTHDPFLMPDMQKSVERLAQALEKNEHICIYADFDCDGIPGATVAYEALTKLGFTNIRVYIPHRDLEGYGFHEHAVDTLLKEGVSLIVTVDVGTVAHDTCAYAQGKGIDVIVTDHHEPSATLPAAFAVINPKRAPYPFPELCGAATVYKLMQACIQHLRTVRHVAVEGIPIGWEKWLLDLVAIATVADMVPLVGENRVLVQYGLFVARKTGRPGIVALCKKTRTDQKSLSEEDVGFSIAPRINAASRMDVPEKAFRLLSATDAVLAEDAAAELEKLNSERKGIVASLVKEVHKRVHARAHKGRVLVVGDPTWKPALLGLAASSLVDTYGGMVCVWGRSGNSVLKGSCRSDGSVSVAELLCQATDLLLEHGGHRQAGGFSIDVAHVHELEERLNERAVGEVTVTPDVRALLPLTLRDIGRDTLAVLQHFAPFGLGNTMPLFVVHGVVVESVRTFGKSSEHLEVVVTDGVHSAKTLCFFKSAEGCSRAPVIGASVSVVGRVEKDAFTRSVRFRFEDIRTPFQ